MRIRSRLVVLVLAVLVPAFLAAAIGIGYVYGEQQDSYRQTLRETTRALALVLDKEIAGREAILQTLAASPALANNELANFLAQANQIAAERGSAIILSEPAEHSVSRTTGQNSGEAAMLDMLSALRKRQHAEGTVVSNLYAGELGMDARFAIQIPALRGGKLAHFLTMTVPVRQLQTVMESRSLPEGWIVTIVDRKGVVVARNRKPEKFVAQSATGPIREKLMRDAEGFNEGKALSGEQVVASFSRAQRSGWSMVISVPQGEIRHAAINAIAFMGAISLMLLALAVAAASAVGRTISGPIEKLRQSAEKLGRGESLDAKTSDIVEIDEVELAMAHASEEIRSARIGLEHRIADAVAAAERSQRALLQAQKLEALGHLTAGIAHDFNNVLQTLTTGLQLARLSSHEPRVVSAIESCQRAVQRGTGLASQLMAFGRVQEARLELVDPGMLVEAAAPLLKGGLRGDIELSMEADGRIWPVLLDPLQFEMALLNLAVNARDAMPSGGTLNIALRNEKLREPLDGLAPGDYVRVAVIDSGHGMHQDVLSRAVDPFFTTKGVGKGAGIGLSQAYGFAKQSGGNLVLQSEPGKGTQAIFYLPRAHGYAEPAKSTGTAQPKACRAARILLVEDDALIRDVVHPALEAAGFHVAVARNGEEAIGLIESEQCFDLVFSDIVMPGTVNGFDLARAVRVRFPALQIILATGYADQHQNIPGVMVIPKPYDVASLVEAVNKSLEQIE